MGNLYCRGPRLGRRTSLALWRPWARSPPAPSASGPPLRSSSACPPRVAADPPQPQSSIEVAPAHPAGGARRPWPGMPRGPRRCSWRPSPARRPRPPVQTALRSGPSAASAVPSRRRPSARPWPHWPRRMASRSPQQPSHWPRSWGGRWHGWPGASCGAEVRLLGSTMPPPSRRATSGTARPRSGSRRPLRSPAPRRPTSGGRRVAPM
mmetsp:Transcript_122716/g.392972  ORF Transcript_122716/g.392972 Transcript_122716/m.392972 type:complete len:208 (-) Transcript_122716:3176-3799(-)